MMGRAWDLSCPFEDLVVLLREARKLEAWVRERGIIWIWKHDISKFVILVWLRLVSNKKPAENNYLKKWSCSDFCLISFSVDLIPLPICSVSAMSSLMRSHSFFSFGQLPETTPVEKGLFKPQWLTRDLGAEKYRVQRSSDYLWELVRGNELICDACKLETQLQGGREGWGIQLVVTQMYLSLARERRAAASGDPGHAQSPVSALNEIPLKESPSPDKKAYVPFPNILS